MSNASSSHHAPGWNLEHKGEIAPGERTVDKCQDYARNDISLDAV